MKGTVTILWVLAAHNPSSLDTYNNLRNILNGVNAASNVNQCWHSQKPSGDSFVDEWNVSHRLLIQKKDPGRHYGIKSSVKIADDQVQVYPQLLFQRLIIACDNSQLMWLKIPWL